MSTEFVKEVNEFTPEAAILFFRQKGYDIGFDYRDVWNQSHATSFTAAKAMQLSILETLKDDIDLAIEKGIPFSEFKRGIVPKLASQGWWGTQKITDPKTGKSQDVNIGSSRLKNIYDTNLRTSHGEGQWIRIQDNKDVFPYLRANTCNSMRPRQKHCMINGMTLHVDDWMVHFPDGFGCKCRFTQLTRGQAKKGKIDDPPKVKHSIYENPRTGEKIKVPEFNWTYKDKKGVLRTDTYKTDPSFSYPQGAYYNHLIEYTLGLSKQFPTPVVTTQTEGMLNSHKKLSDIGYKHKNIRTNWPKMDADKRLEAAKTVLADIRKAGPINVTLSTTWQRQHYDNARERVKYAENPANEADKQTIAGEAMSELGLIVGMLENLPESVQRVITK